MPETAATLAVPDAKLNASLWRKGNLYWLLHDEQQRLFDKCVEWRARMRTDKRGKYRRFFVVGWSRRVGKDYWCLVMALTICLQKPGSRGIYATAYAKDIAEIVIPLMDEILETCPEDIRPKFHESSLGESAGYFFPNGSRIKLVGVDLHPKALRGRALDFAFLSEAAFITSLKDVALSILRPQLQGRPDSFIALQSTAPEVSAGNAFDEVFVPDAKLRDAYDEANITDNPLLTAEEVQEEIDGLGGIDDPRVQREYFNVRARDEAKAVVPEYDDREGGRHVRPVPTPEYAHCYVGADPGVRDMCGIVWGYWDPWQAKLMVQRDFAERNASTGKVAKVMLETERALWSQVTYFDGDGLRSNPYQRFSDVDLRLIGDLSAEHGISIAPVDRADDKEARLFSFRDAFARDKIQIDPSCVTLRAHLQAATWNKRRTEYERTEAHGHYDCMDALEIMWRMVNRSLDPRPPAQWLDRSLVTFNRQHQMERGDVRAMGRALGGKPSWQMGRTR